MASRPDWHLLRCVTDRSAANVLFAKHILGGDALMARVMYWELDNWFQAQLTRSGKFPRRHPVWLLRGFFGYCWVRILRVFQPTPQDQGSANSER